MRLIAVRHGETEWNVQGREMGQMDSALTSNGIAQAHAIARRLSSISFHALYTSDLGRALRTAEIIGRTCGHAPKISESLRERHMGIFQGLTLEEIQQQFPQERSTYTRDGFEYIIPGGESARQRLERSVRTFSDLAVKHLSQTIVAVTHGGILMGLFEHVLGLAPGSGGRFKRQNGSISTFEYDDDKWVLETWNDVSHLTDIEALNDPSAAPP